MPYTYTKFSGFRVPDENAADDVPADLSFLFDQADTVTFLRATSIGDRDSRYYDAPSGVVCVVKNADDAVSEPGRVFGVYIKTSNAGTVAWGTIWEPPTALSLTAITLAEPYNTRGSPSYDPGVWREPGGIFAQMAGAIVRQDGGAIASGSTVGYLPSGFLPMRASADYPVATAYSGSGGYGNNKIAIGVDGALTYYGPGTVWVSFDSIRYFLAQS